MNKKIKLSNIIPVIVLIGLIIIFSAFSKGRFLTAYNLKAIVEQAIPFIVGGLGMVFVVALGSADLSQGSVIGVIAILCALLCRPLGAWSVLVVGAVAGGVFGPFSGTVTSRFKVSSFLITLALMIALRALTQLLLSFKAVMVTPAVMNLDKMAIKIPIVIVLIAVCWYLFEYTRFGYYCKCIGENERTANSSGVNVKLIKTMAFVISGVMAGIAGALNVARLGGANATMGNMFEMRVMMALFIGGVSVTGGMTTKMHKLIIGAFVIAVLENGLTICSVTGAIYEFIEGAVLITVVAAALFLGKQAVKNDERQALKQAEATEVKEASIH